MYSASRSLSYAPSPYSYTPNPSLSAKINLDEEVKLSHSAAEQDLLDSLAEIYSIIRTLDGLEKVYTKDAVTETQYTEMCSKMLKHYKSILTDENVSGAFVDLETFTRKWSLECPRAVERLRIGIPSTIEQTSSHNAPTNTHNNGSNHPPASARPVLIAGENFITFLDALKLNMVSKTQLHPLLSEVIQSVNKVTEGDFENRDKIIKWLIKLNQMGVSDELSEEETRELEFDMDSAYSGFKAVIH